MTGNWLDWLLNLPVPRGAFLMSGMNTSTKERKAKEKKDIMANGRAESPNQSHGGQGAVLDADRGWSRQQIDISHTAGIQTVTSASTDITLLTVLVVRLVQEGDLSDGNRICPRDSSSNNNFSLIRISLPFPSKLPALLTLTSLTLLMEEINRKEFLQTGGSYNFQVSHSRPCFLCHNMDGCTVLFPYRT